MFNQLKILANSHGHAGRGLALLCALTLSGVVHATTYVLPQQGDVIGHVQYVRAAAGDTLQHIARQYDVGINAIQMANPGVNPKSLREGERIVIPSRYILPDGPRKGIVINLAEKRLYHYTRPEMGPPLVSTYPVSIGRDSDLPLGNHTIARRLRKPSWAVPDSVRRKNPGMPAHMLSGPDNPLGEYAMSLNIPGCMIHGTNQPHSIGMDVELGCIRLYPEDIAVLVHRTLKDSPVRIVNQDFKSGYHNGALYFEIHKPEAAGELNLAALVNTVTAVVPRLMWDDDWQRVRLTGNEATGLATPIAQLYRQPKQGRSWMLQLASYKHYSSARNLMLQLEELDLPVTTSGCETTGGCRVLAGPFSDHGYMKEISKRIKWITRIKAITVPYQPEEVPLRTISHQQTVALGDSATHSDL